MADDECDAGDSGRLFVRARRDAMVAGRDLTINYGSSEEPVLGFRSAYRDQVEQFFLRELLGRDAELSELAAFCTTGAGGSYAWWQAPAWAGKSALMASFVLAPPSGVRVVSFFITARWAGQSDRAAFLEAMLEQLAEVCGQPVPQLPGESARQRWFGRMLKDAASSCAAEGQRLVLVVDGLDEDSGVTTGRDAHSIAALLPPAPPSNVLFVVTGRPDPPLPADVPHWHPLRDPQVIRRLSPSPHALLARNELERELALLLDDDGLGHDLLGLVAAAGGGLSEDDLAELAHRSQWEIRRFLSTAPGRTFTTLGVAGKAPAFVLAHEELQQAAVTCLGERAMLSFRARLHAWADSFRVRRWPEATPEYLLRGYHRLLHALGDADRMADLAADQARQDCLRDFDGGDAAVFTEISATQELALARDEPNVAMLLRLAAARSRLAWRAVAIPEDLPAVWADLGEPSRAIALASRGTMERHAWETITLLVAALVRQGDNARAERLRRRAEIMIGSEDNPRSVAFGLPSLASMAAALGERDRYRETLARAQDAARKVDDPWRAGALEHLARVLLENGEDGQAVQAAAEAEAACRKIKDNEVRTRHLLSVARTWIRLGDTAEAERLLRKVASPASGAAAETSLAAKLTLATTTDQIRRIASRHLRNRDSRMSPACERVIAEKLAATGNLDAAEETASGVTERAEQTEAWATLARAAIARGEPDRARRLATLATTSAGLYKNASVQASVVAAFAGALAIAGDTDQAAHLARQAHNMLESLDRLSKVLQMNTLARTWAQLAKPHEALEAVKGGEALTASLDDEYWRSACLAHLAGTLADLRLDAKAAALLNQAAVIAHQPGVGYPEYALFRLAEAYSHAGKRDDAETTCRQINGPRARAEALAALSVSDARAGRQSSALKLAEEAEELARSGDDGTYWQHAALGAAATALAAAGEHQRAESIAMSLPPLPEHALALAKTAEWLPGPRARKLFARALINPKNFDLLLPPLARTLPEITCAGITQILQDQPSLVDTHIPA